MKKLVGEHRRYGLYLPEEDYRKLKAHLDLKGKTVSWWFRAQIKRTLAQTK